MTTRTVTYGDTFTLPSVTYADTGEPILWKIGDARSTDDAGDMYHKRATIYPVSPEGNRLSGNTPVKIGRTARLLDDVGTYHAIEWAHNRLRGSISSSALTEKMRATLAEEFAAVKLDLPGWSVAELRTALIREAARYGQSLSYLDGHSRRADWDKYRQSAEARAFWAEALDAATRTAMHDALVATFSAGAADSLKVTR